MGSVYGGQLRNTSCVQRSCTFFSIRVTISCLCNEGSVVNHGDSFRRRVAQGESASLTRKRSGVQDPPRLPYFEVNRPYQEERILYPRYSCKVFSCLDNQYLNLL